MYVFRSPPHPRGIEHKSRALPLRGEERGRSRLFREEGVVETYPSGNDRFGKGGFINISHILSLDWHNRFLRNWELKISNLYYIHYVKNSFHYPLPITHYHALRSVTLQGAECGI